ncbi:MAG: nucleoside deaminase [Chromatiales bacterium]|nr:nucleoside deaminase [Chromatiales bacterium]
MSDEVYLAEAVALAERSVEQGGGPFGALVVRDDVVIGRGSNSVTLNNDPTAHAEVLAIRDACRTINDFSLEGSTLYSSCEPCPMCLSAIYWARVGRVIFAASREQAAEAGFDDSVIGDEIALPLQQRQLPMRQLGIDGSQPFMKWQAKEDKRLY